MVKVKNPRFPHSCRIVRYDNGGAMVDQRFASDDPMQDEAEETFDPAADAAGTAADAPGTVADDTETVTDGTVVYEGVCRSDNHYQTTGSGDVNVSYRTLSLPKKQDEWSDADIPREGDNVELQRFGYKEYGTVIDVKPSNLGTHLYWKYARN